MTDQLPLTFSEARTEDRQELGYIERRPVPLRPVGMPVGRDERGMPIYRPNWMDYEWFATWVAAADIDRARLIRHTRFTHIKLCDTDSSSNDPLDPRRTDWRDSYATMRDLWRGLGVIR